MAKAKLELLAKPDETVGNGQDEATEEIISSEDAPSTVPSDPAVSAARRIAICGTAPSTRDKIPFGEPEFEFWSLNDAWKVFPILEGEVNGRPRMVWFETHPREWFTGPNRPPDHLEWLRACKIPIYMWEHFEDIPSSIAYPFEEMCKKFPGATARWELGPDGKPMLTRQHGYLTSTIAYMVALAITELQPGEELWFWGVDLAADTEYCLAPETRVLTADLRWVPISDVQIGQDLIGFDEEPVPQEKRNGDVCSYRQWRRATVTNADRLTRPCSRIHLANGETLVASNEHRWLTSNSDCAFKWLPTTRLRTPQHHHGYTHLVKAFETWSQNTSWEAGYLAAALDGEGSIAQRDRKSCHGMRMEISFAQRDNPMRDAVFAIARELGFGFRGGDDATGCGKFSIKGGKAETLRCLGTVRPPRLLAQFNPDCLGVIHQPERVAVTQVEPVGEREVIGLGTTTGTFFAEGYASHNSRQRPGLEYLLGYAEAKGIRVALPSACPVLKGPFYGREDPRDAAADTVRQKIEMLWQRDVQTKRKAEGQNLMLQGRLQAWEELRAEWPSR